MTTDTERQRVLEQIKNLANYVHNGEAWRVRSIELAVARIIKELRVAEGELYNRLTKGYGGTD